MRRQTQKNTISRRKNHTKRKPTEPKRRKPTARQQAGRNTRVGVVVVVVKKPTHTSRNEPPAAR